MIHVSRAKYGGAIQLGYTVFTNSRPTTTAKGRTDEYQFLSVTQI